MKHSKLGFMHYFMINFKAGRIVGLATLLSRFLGLVREVLFTSLLGSASLGLFLIAFRIPNLLRELFAEGALSTAFISVFSKCAQEHPKEQGWQLASQMLTLTAILMSVVCLIGIGCSSLMVSYLTPRLHGLDRSMIIFLTQLMYPFIFFISLAAIVMGILNSYGSFTTPALASSFFNLGSILGGALLGWWIDPSFSARALTGLALGTVLGGFLQFAIQIPAMYQLGFRYRWSLGWREPRIKEIIQLTGPAILAASAVQINVLINTSFAAYIGNEAVTWLNSAFRLIQLPIGIFGVAIATITLPVLSKLMVQNPSDWHSTLHQALRAAIFLTLPAAVGLCIMAHPIVSLLYEHGQFSVADAAQTALALQCYTLGLLPYSGIKILSPAFLAIGKKWIPVWISLIAVIFNILLNAVLIGYFHLGQHYLALSSACSAILSFVLLLLAIHHFQRLCLTSLLRFMVKILVATVPMAFIAWVGWLELNESLSYSPYWMRILNVILVITICVMVYIGVTFKLNVNFVTQYMKKITPLFRERLAFMK